MKPIIYSLSLFLTLSFAALGTTQLDCQSAPGGYLCRQLGTIQNLMGTHCTGSPCTNLFHQQARAYATFVEYYNQNVFANPTASNDIAALAQNVAGSICNYRWTGNANTFSATIFHGNQLLVLLKEVQKAAGYAAVRYCQLEIS